MPFGNSRFRPSLFATVITVIAVSIFLSLAAWQWERAKYKESQIAKMLEQNEQAPLQLQNATSVDWPRQRYRMVQLKGEFEYSHEVLLDNVVLKGKPGYSVITPFKIEGHQQRILLNRGWLPVGNDRNILPTIKQPLGEMQIAGQIDAPAGRPFILGEHAPDDEGNQRWAFWDMDYAKQHYPYPIADFIVLQLNDTADGLRRTKVPIKNKAGMHYGYTIQWGLFALIAIVSYIKLNMRKKGQQND